jgi:L-malate glycosyltransferase
MTKVLHIVPSFNQGGSERQALQLAAMLRRDSIFDLHLACLDPTGSLRAEAEQAGFEQVPAFPLTSFYDVNMARQLMRFVDYVRRERFCVVQSHDFYTNIFAMIGARIARVPVRIAAKRETGMRSNAQRAVERRAFGCASRVVVNSTAVAETLVSEGVPRRKLSVIHNGIDLGRFALNGWSRSGFLARLGLPVGARTVALLANLRDNVKDYPMFLRAAALLKEQFDDLFFLAAGEGGLMDQMKEQAVRLGLKDRVLFLGRCSQVPELLSASDICVLTSQSEGFSNAILEYMASSRPSVVTDVGGAREAIIDGESGFIVPPGNADELAQRLAYLLNNADQARSIGRAARKRAEEHFSLAAQLQKTLDLYRGELQRTGVAS